MIEPMRIGHGCFSGCRQQVHDVDTIRRIDREPTLETHCSTPRSGLHRTC